MATNQKITQGDKDDAKRTLTIVGIFGGVVLFMFVMFLASILHAAWLGWVMLGLVVLTFAIAYVRWVWRLVTVIRTPLTK